MNPTPEPTYWAQLLVPAASGLLGTFLGGWIANRNQSKERKHRRYREQLGFYAELLSIRKVIYAKSELRTRVSVAAHNAWKEDIRQAAAQDPQSPLTKELYARPENEYDRLEDYSNKQTTEEIIPLYRKMLDVWIANMSHAEPSTQKHFEAFVEFVEMWNRFLQKSLPATVIKQMPHEEKKLYPLYEDIVANVERLRKELLK